MHAPTDRRQIDRVVDAIASDDLGTVDRDTLTEVVEAARGMGMTEKQILRRVELPLATPLLFSGVRTAVVFVVASATIAAIAGGGGLGDVIVNQASYGIEGVIAASILVSVLAFACDGVVAFAVCRLMASDALLAASCSDLLDRCA